MQNPGAGSWNPTSLIDSRSAGTDLRCVDTKTVDVHIPLVREKKLEANSLRSAAHTFHRAGLRATASGDSIPAIDSRDRCRAGPLAWAWLWPSGSGFARGAASGRAVGPDLGTDLMLAPGATAAWWSGAVGVWLCWDDDLQVHSINCKGERLLEHSNRPAACAGRPFRDWSNQAIWREAVHSVCGTSCRSAGVGPWARTRSSVTFAAGRRMILMAAVAEQPTDPWNPQQLDQQAAG